MIQMTRRDLFQSAASFAAVSALNEQSMNAQTTPGPGKLGIAIFSKHLEFLEGEELAKGLRETGADGVDLAVRKGGHVEPDRVKQELPGLVSLLRKSGLEVPMLTTDIADVDTPHTEDILAVMAELGIHHYRWGGFKWADNTPLTKQIEELRPRVAKLAELNRKYKATAIYHTHSGVGLVGAAIWDLHEILKGMDPNAVAVNYDVGHATVEGGLGGWIESFRITGPYLKGVAVKDFAWEKSPKGVWQAKWKPLGEGMVNFPKFFDMLREAKFSGPLQLHFEYPLGGAENGKKKDLGMSRADILTAMKKDVGILRRHLVAAKLA